MVEPTESESKEELDRFIDTMNAIFGEIREVEIGVADAVDNVLTNAPHTAEMLTVNDWTHAYSREKAAYPLEWLRENKFWVPVGRVDNAWGDRNLFCTCEPLEDYK
jgi:glycine dehydrogenase